MAKPDDSDPKAKTGGADAGLWIALMPPAFVFLWSTGFVGARYGLPYVEALTFVALRLTLTAVILTPIVLLWRAPWPSGLRDIRHIATAGILMNALGLGGMFSAMGAGMPLAVVALIGALQPLLTGLFAGVMLDERVSRKQWLGLVLGLGGVILVLYEKLGAGGVSPAGVAMATTGLLGFTFGTLYQKRFCANMNLRTGSAIQFLASGGLMLALSSLIETRPIEWTTELVLALVWLAVVLSIGAMTLLWLLVRRGAASKVASLFYMTPPVTALMAYALFGETLGLLALIGMGIAAYGVALVTRGT